MICQVMFSYTAECPEKKERRKPHHIINSESVSDAGTKTTTRVMVNDVLSCISSRFMIMTASFSVRHVMVQSEWCPGVHIFKRYKFYMVLARFIVESRINKNLIKQPNFRHRACHMNTRRSRSTSRSSFRFKAVTTCVEEIIRKHDPFKCEMKEL